MKCSLSTQLQDSFIETYGDNAKKNRVIFNSYDSTRFYLEGRGRSQDRHDGETGAQNVITLCTVASLSDLKGQLRVLSGLTLLPDRKKFKYFCIGGDNSGLAGKLEEYAKKNDIDFEYLGTMTPDEIRKELRKADYMIMPSSSEGFGLSYLESIACGVPVILPKNLPIAQEKSLINRGNSILLDDCSAESIAKVLGRIDDFHFDREAVADTISGFSWEEIARQYVNAFKELCDEYNR